MGSRMKQLAALALAGTVVAGCAVRLGGTKPAEYDVVGLRAAANASSADVAARVREAGGEILLLHATGDSAWFADVGTQTGLALYGPGRPDTAGGPALAFFTNLKLLGDTTLAVPITAGGRLLVHDALFEITEGRNIDLMVVSFAEAPSARDGVRALLNYIATDVGGTSALLIGLASPSPAVADSASALMRAAFRNVLECNDEDLVAPAGGLGLAVFYGPEARIECESSRVLPGTPAGITARVVVGRW